MIIGINGKIGTGKDTLASYYVENFGFKRLAFADAVKKIAAMTLGPHFSLENCVEMDKTSRSWRDQPYQVTPEFSISPREAWQKIGTDAMRNTVWKDVWLNAFDLQIDPKYNYVVPDLRFPNEADFLKKKGAFLIKVVREIPGSKFSDHLSETSLDFYNEFNLMIVNEGTLKDLYAMAEGAIELFSKR